MSLPFFLLLYFCIIVGGASIVISPRIRNFIRQKAQGAFNRCRNSFNRVARVPKWTLFRIDHINKLCRNTLSKIWGRRYLALSVSILLILPTLVAIFNRNDLYFSFTDRADVDPRVQLLLAGERLSPPEPLPPEVFTTREVELVRPLLASANREWNLLDADFRQLLLSVFRIMKEEHGYEMVLIEGYRSPERQEKLALVGKHVTNAKAYQSYHQYGLAADSAFFREGKIIISEKDPWAMKGYQLYGETAEKLGLTWGGRWKMMDFGHVEFRRPGTILPR